MSNADKRDLRERFSARIAELRQLSGYTLEEFGNAIGTSAHAAAQIERGEVFPKWQRFEAIARFLRVEVMDLFDSRPERKMPPLLPKVRASRHVVRKQTSKTAARQPYQE